MIDLTLFAMVIAACLQPNRAACLAAVVVWLPFHLFSALSFTLDDAPVYFIAAGVDLLIIYLLGTIRPITKLAVNLQRACTLSLILNGFGLLLWWLYFSPVLYNALMFTLNVYIVWLMARNTDHVGSDRNTYGDRPLSFCFTPRYLRMQADKAEI